MSKTFEGNLYNESCKAYRDRPIGGVILKKVINAAFDDKYKLLCEPVVKVINGEKITVRSYCNTQSDITAEKILMDMMLREIEKGSDNNEQTFK